MSEGADWNHWGLGLRLGFRLCLGFWHRLSLRLRLGLWRGFRLGLGLGFGLCLRRHCFRRWLWSSFHLQLWLDGFIDIHWYWWEWIFLYSKLPTNTGNRTIRTATHYYTLARNSWTATHMQVNHPQKLNVLAAAKHEMSNPQPFDMSVSIPVTLGEHRLDSE